MDTNWPAQATRLLVFEVEAWARDGERLFVAGVLKLEPARVGDAFSSLRAGATVPERVCALRIESILWRGAYVTWIDTGKTVELGLSGDVDLELPTGAELRGESKPPLGAFGVMGRGERRTQRR